MTKLHAGESTLVAVYDILNCGPRSRFSANGKLVHNSEYNMQNLPRIDDKKPKISDALRNCLKAPLGYQVIVADQSGIELRVNHFLWKVKSSMDLYAGNPEADLYKAFAAARYQKTPEEVTKPERQLAKLCLSEGTLILTRKSNNVSWVPIEAFTPDRQLWDGKDWVWAKGVVSNGWKPTQQLCGVWLTPDHQVLSGTQWLQAKDVQGERIFQALDVAAENLSLRELLPSLGAGSPRLSLSAIVGFLSTRLRVITSRTLRRQGATAVRKKQRVKSVIGNMFPQCLKTRTGLDYLTDYPPQSTDARKQQTLDTTTTVGGELKFAVSGGTIEHRSLRTAGHWLAGTYRRLKWIVSTATATTPRATLGLSAAGTTCSTSAKFQNFSSESLISKRNSPVYDITDCGPRNRFTVLSSRGPLIVHNCQLGLGFGAGHKTFKRIAKQMGGLDLTDDESEGITDAWRAQYAEIVRGWKVSGAMLQRVHAGEEHAVDPWGMVTTCSEGLRLPSGRLIRYPQLRQEEGKWPDGRVRQDWVYASGRHKSYMHGGKVVENMVQALARDSIFDCSVDFYRSAKLRPCLRVHDELVYVVPNSEAVSLLAELQRIMRTPPKWWPELVVHSEGDSATSYGAAK